MPNYGLVVTPTYTPMSYEQYIAPFKEYAQIYNETADKADELEMAASQWERLADSEVDKPQYQQYQTYINDLRSYAEELATKGLTNKTRAGLSRARQRYAKEIKPIEEAFNYRAKLAEEQRKLNPKGDIQWDVDFSNIGLGSIMANPSLGYKGRSLSEMEQEGFEQAKALSTRVLSEPAKAMANQYFMVRQGYSAEEADKWLARQHQTNPEAATEAIGYIDNIYDQIKKSYNLDSDTNGFTGSQNAEADKRIASGIVKGLTAQDSYQTNYYAKPHGSGSGSSTTEQGWFIDDKHRYWYEPYGTKGFGRVLDITKPIKDKNGKVVDYEPVVDEEGVVSSYNPDKDTFDTKSGTVIINGKAKKAQQRETQEMYDKVEVVVTQKNSKAKALSTGYQVKDFSKDPNKRIVVPGLFNDIKLDNTEYDRAFSFKDILRAESFGTNDDKSESFGQPTYSSEDGKTYKIGKRIYNTEEEAQEEDLKRYIKYHFRNVPSQVREHPENYIVEVRKQGSRYIFVLMPTSTRTAYTSDAASQMVGPSDSFNEDAVLYNAANTVIPK